MKLRFRRNSLRLRVNRHEVEQLASGHTLREEICFPNSRLAYELVPTLEDRDASQGEGLIQVRLPQQELRAWAANDDIGIYFEIPNAETSLRIAIEKDLACVDGPEEEHDPLAFPRQTSVKC